MYGMLVCHREVTIIEGFTLKLLQTVTLHFTSFNHGQNKAEGSILKLLDIRSTFFCKFLAWQTIHG
uniref:Uncharacterized protein n=1 Tax=Romanomermis culicivorax TaxID=13658 RepID=A0A915IXB4_ROMCU